MRLRMGNYKNGKMDLKECNCPEDIFELKLNFNA